MNPSLIWPFLSGKGLDLPFFGILFFQRNWAVGAAAFLQDQIIRFGGHTDPSLPWPEKHHDEGNSTEKSLGRRGVGSGAEGEFNRAFNMVPFTQDDVVRYRFPQLGCVFLCLFFVFESSVLLLKNQNREPKPMFFV